MLEPWLGVLTEIAVGRCPEVGPGFDNMCLSSHTGFRPGPSSQSVPWGRWQPADLILRQRRAGATVSWWASFQESCEPLDVTLAA